MRYTCVLSSLLFVATASAQTFVVDANNGPGTDFTSLATATATVPDGAVLRVRPGSYPGPVAIQAKSLTVLGDPGAQIESAVGVPFSLTIDAIGVSQSVVVRGLRMYAATAGTQTGVRCSNSPGLICVDDVSPSVPTAGVNVFEATACASLWLRACGFSGRATVAGSEVVMVRCTMPTTNQAQQTGIEQAGGSLQLVDCLVRGVNVFGANGGPAVAMSGGALRLSGQTTLLGGQSFGGANGFAIGGSGTARRDPAVVASGFAPGVQVSQMPMATVSIAEIAPAGTVQADLRGPVGEPGFLLVGLTGPAFVLSGVVEDSIWLDPFVMFVVASGIPAAGAPVSHQMFMPALSTAPGFKIVWQGLTLGAAGLQISNPEYFVVP